MPSSKLSKRRKYAGTPKTCRKPPAIPPFPPAPIAECHATAAYYPLLDFFGTETDCSTEGYPPGQPIETTTYVDPFLPHFTYAKPLNKGAHGGWAAEHPEIGVVYLLRTTFDIGAGHTVTIDNYIERPA